MQPRNTLDGNSPRVRRGTAWPTSDRSQWQLDPWGQERGGPPPPLPSKLCLSPGVLSGSKKKSLYFLQESISIHFPGWT